MMANAKSYMKGTLRLNVADLPSGVSNLFPEAKATEDASSQVAPQAPADAPTTASSASGSNQKVDDSQEGPKKKRRLQGHRSL